MRRGVLLAASVATFATGIASGKSCDGVDFPDQVQVDGSALALNGLGLRLATFLKVKVYVGALYVARKSGDAGAILAANAPYELVLQFVRDVGGSDIAKGWSEGFDKNAKGQLPALKERIATLNGYMPDVKSGQKFRFTFRPGTGLQVDVNGTVKGTIQGDDFGKAFLSIWLGDPPNDEIKAGLLGGACG